MTHTARSIAAGPFAANGSDTHTAHLSPATKATTGNLMGSGTVRSAADGTRSPVGRPFFFTRQLFSRPQLMRLGLAFGLSLVTAALLLALSTLFAGDVAAQSVNVDLGEGGTISGRVVQLILLVTVVSLAPGILVMTTSFTRIIVVLSVLRSALGTQSTPPNIVMVSLALFLTAYIMAPTFTAVYEQAVEPLINEQIDETEAFNRASVPMKAFMISQVRDDDVVLFHDLAGAPLPENITDVELTKLVPAFIISELRRAFEIAFLVYMPFIIIDMVIASTLMSMGMMMLPPVMISLPFKIIFFVLVDGWRLVVGSLVQSFGTAPPATLG